MNSIFCNFTEKGVILKTLILYGTTHGSTAFCAEKLAAELGSADAAELKHFSGSIAPYDCIIIGSPVYGGSVLKEVRSFCKANCAALLQKKFAVFFSCLSEDETSIKNYLSQNFSKELAAHTLACASLGGAFYFTKLNFLERAIDRGLAKGYANSMGIAVPDGKSDFVTVTDEKVKRFAEKINKAAGEVE